MQPTAHRAASCSRRAVSRPRQQQARRYSQVPSASAHTHGRESTGFDGVAGDEGYRARYRDSTACDRERWRANSRTVHNGQPSLNSDKQRHNTDTEQDTKPLACLFPGVGSQFTGMASALMKSSKVFRDTWAEAEEALAGFEQWRTGLEIAKEESLKSLELESWPPWMKERAPDQLRKIVYGGAPQALLMKSSNSQPAIMITSIALLRTLEQEFDTPIRQWARYFCGHSSGEYSACVASGSLSFQDGVRLTRLQGLLTSRTMSTIQMEPPSSDTAPPNRKSQMSAVLVHPGHSHEEVTAVVEEVRQQFGAESEGRVEVAAYNSTYQIVLTGSAAGVNHACDIIRTREIGVHVANLPSWAPFHSSFMKAAEAGMRMAFERGVEVSAPAQGKYLVSCLTGQLAQTPQEITDCVVNQIVRPVQWSTALSNLRNDYGIRQFAYFGPGKALANLAKREVERGCWESKEAANDWTIASIASAEDMRKTGKDLS